MSKTLIYIAGSNTGDTLDELFPWAIVGVYTDEKEAVRACIKERHLVIEQEVNAPPNNGENSVFADVAWYPLLETKDEGIARCRALNEAQKPEGPPNELVSKGGTVKEKVAS